MDEQNEAHADGRNNEAEPANVELNQFGETVSFVWTTRPGSKIPVIPELPIASRIGRYEIREVLGRGAFGTVYRGFDDKLTRDVAIKVPHNVVPKDKEEEFLSEARQLARLKHPNIVAVHDVGVEGQVCFIVSECLAGKDLNHWLADREIEWQQSVGIVAALADALATAHAVGTVHRDVKPANIIMTERGGKAVPVLVDFGLALSQALNEVQSSQRGVITGTPNYMSPEQARGEGHRVDGRTDVYALGVILYRMLSGQLPFTGGSVTELLESVISDEPRPPRQFVRGLPRELERICLKAMAKSVSDRYTTASDLAEDLHQLLRDHEDQLVANAAKPTAQDAVKRQPTRILIADDHELTRFKLQNDLQKWGHQVTAAEDGEQAWQLFQQDNFSIVVTDWMMPKMDGLKLVKLIRSANTASYAYIIMLTAKSEKHDIIAGMGAGADDFLSKPFNRDELQVRLRAGIRITSLNRELSETNRRLQQSQEAALQIQRSFLPAVKPRVPGCSFAWRHLACESLGGDMLNFVTLDEEHVGLYVLDVTGDGVPAALLATALSRVLSPPSDPASILVDRDDSGNPTGILEPLDAAKRINKRFGVQEERCFFTFAYGVLDMTSRTFQFTSAGHPPLLHVRKNSDPRMLDVEGYPVGLDPDLEQFEQTGVQLEPGDRLLIYSDGLTDALSPQGDVFGAARLLESVSKDPGCSLEDLLRAITSDVQDWRGEPKPTDDMSILAVEVL